MRFTRLLLTCTLLSALGLTASAASEPTAPADAPATPTNPSGFVIRRGTNLSHWLSQDFGWAPREKFITEGDLRYLARLGFDHVRLPIDEKELWHANGKPNEAAFATLLRGIGWARAAGLRVLVDLHTINSHHFNADNEGLKNTLWTDPREQQHFVGLWRQLSARLSHLPVSEVAYEIMNEPVADDAEQWNALIATTHAALRSLEPQRVLVIGSNRWQLPHEMPRLRVPAGDPNIILSVHSYAPYLFTHHRAAWTAFKDLTVPVRYPGYIFEPVTLAALQKENRPELRDFLPSMTEPWDAARIAAEFAPAVEHARKLGLQLYCGEFGCLPTVPRADRLAYYRDFVSALEKLGLAWASWEYKGDFGLYEWHGPEHLTGAPDVELIDALLPRR